MAKPPEFDALWAAYPHADSATVREEIGGAVDNPDYANTCAIRMSRALNYTGHPIPAREGLYAVKGADGKRYALRMKELTEYLQVLWGAPQVRVKSPNGDQSKFDGKKGVISFLGIPGYAGGGHIDLWDGAGTSQGAYFDSSEVLLWESPAPAPETGPLGTSTGGEAASAGTAADPTANEPDLVESDGPPPAPPPAEEPAAAPAEEPPPDPGPVVTAGGTASEGDAYYLLPDGTIDVEYEVLCQPPPATRSTATIFRHEVGGEELGTETLVDQGGSTLSLQLSRFQLADSPLAVQFAFEKEGARLPRVEVARMFALAAAAPWRIEVPADAKPGEALTLRVSEWAALAQDAPGREPNPFSGLDAGRVSADVKSAVKWEVDGAARDETGEQPSVTLDEALAGRNVPVEAYVGDGPAPGYARASIAVPLLRVRGEDGEAPPPDRVDVGGRVTLVAVVSPDVPGAWAWSVEGDQVTLEPDGARVVVTGATETEGEARVKVKARLTSEATSTEYEVEHELAVRKHMFELFLQRSPCFSEGDDRGVEGLAWRVRSGPGEDTVLQEGTTDASGLIHAQMLGEAVFVDLMFEGAAVATYEVRLRPGDFEEVTTIRGQQRRLRSLGFQLGADGPDQDGVDGTIGGRSDAAILEFQVEIGADTTGSANGGFRTELADHAGA